MDMTGWIQEKRAENAFLRANGALVAAERGTKLLDELEAVLRAGDPELTVEEAAARTGVHPETIRRAVRLKQVGVQRVKNGTMTIKTSELPLLAGRRRARQVIGAPSPSSLLDAF